MAFWFEQSRISRRSTCAAIAAASLFGVATLNAYAIQDDWRKMSRTARYKVDDSDYRGAADLYERAIQELRKTDPKSDYVYDLIINLSETHLIAGEFGRARQLLESIESQVLTKNHSDPLLAVRFLRRKSKLDQATGNKARAIEESMKALNILAQYFSRNGEHFQGQLRKLIELLFANQAWRTMAVTVPALKKTDVNIESFCGLIEVAGVHAMDSGDLETAAKLYTEAGRLYESDKSRFNLIGRFNQLSDRCMTAHRLDLTPLIEKECRKLMGATSPQSTIGIRVRSFGHYCVAAILMRRNEMERSMTEWEMVRKLFKEFDPKDITEHDYRLLLTADLTLATEYLKKSIKADQTTEILQEMIELTTLPQETSKLKDVKDFPWYYGVSRFFYARTYSKQKQYTKALEIIDTIDKGMLAKNSDLMKRVAIFREAIVKEMQKSAVGAGQ